MRRGPATVAVVVAAVVVAATGPGCGDDRDTTWDGTYAGVCAAAGHAGAGRLDEARRAFRNRAHDGLHRLAGHLGDEGGDRRAAAGLLRAKQAAERDLTVATAATLLAATRTAVEAATGDDPGTCPD